MIIYFYILLMSLLPIQNDSQRKLLNGKYCSRISDSYFIINGATHTQYYDNGESWIKSQILWISDDKYKLLIQDVNCVDCEYQVGDTIEVTILFGKRIVFSYEAEYKGKVVRGSFKICD